MTIARLTWSQGGFVRNVVFRNVSQPEWRKSGYCQIAKERWRENLGLKKSISTGEIFSEKGHVYFICFVRNSLDPCQSTSNGNKRKPSVGVNIDLPSWQQEKEEETVDPQFDDFEQMSKSKDEEGHHSASDQNTSDYFKYDNIRWGTIKF